MDFHIRPSVVCLKFAGDFGCAVTSGKIVLRTDFMADRLSGWPIGMEFSEFPNCDIYGFTAQVSDARFLALMWLVETIS